MTGHREGFIDACDFGELARGGRRGHPLYECYTPPHHVLRYNGGLEADQPTEAFSCTAHLQPIINLLLTARSPVTVTIGIYGEE